MTSVKMLQELDTDDTLVKDLSIEHQHNDYQRFADTDHDKDFALPAC